MAVCLKELSSIKSVSRNAIKNPLHSIGIRELNNIVDRLSRKLQELALLSGEATPASSETEYSLLEKKLRSAAALKSHFIQSHYSCTQTNWSDENERTSDFVFSFDYQRANLAVTGPAVYPNVGSDIEQAIIYTSGGMSALAAVMLALKSGGAQSVTARSEGYPETRELASLLSLKLTTRNAQGIGLIDSGSASQKGWESIFESSSIVIVDTTCFAASSGSVGRWIRYARERGHTLLLIRSHTKLDTLGIEYGRLGSIVILNPILGLVEGIRDAVRLIGASALPSELPPFISDPEYRRLTRMRAANIMRNTRLLCRLLNNGGCAPKRYRHGMYSTLPPIDAARPDEVGRNCVLIADRARTKGLTVQHAGSFGFDFTSIDWFNESDYTVLRIAPGDVDRGEMAGLAEVLIKFATRSSSPAPNKFCASQL